MRRYAEVGRDFPLTRGGALARETLAAMLSSEVAAIGSALEAAASARTTADVEYTLGRARKLLRMIENLPLPADLYEAWESDRDRLSARVAQLLSN
jgi:hypothetical protein